MANITGTNASASRQGTTAADVISTFDGNDRVHGRSGSDSVSGGADNDTLYGMSGSDTLVGNADDDLLFGGSGHDSLSGTSGNDTFAIELDFDFGDDTFAGGSDRDVAIVRSSAFIEVNDSVTQTFQLESQTGVSINLINRFLPGVVQTFSPTLETTGALGINLGDVRGSIRLDSIEEIHLTAFSDLILDDDSDREILGLGGDDFISGGGGADIIDGGTGRDTALYGGSNAAVSVVLLDLGSGASASGGHAEGDRLISIENVEGSGFDDFLMGSNDDNRLVGSGGDDDLFGLNGDDTLFGGAGDDLLVGGAGADSLVGDSLDTGTPNGQDTVSYSLSTLGVTVDLSIGRGLRNDATGDRYVGIEHAVGSRGDDVLRGTNEANALSGGDGFDQINGGGGSDTLSGGDDNDILFGGFGADLLQGGAGDDTLDGSFDDDLINGGAGFDMVSYASLQPTAAFGETAAQSGVEMFLSSPFGGTSGVAVTASRLADGRIDPAGAVSVDSLIAIEHAEGSGFSDTVFGDTGANRLLGGGGADNIHGGTGADTIEGGADFDFASYYGSAVGVAVSLLDGRGTAGDAAGDSLVTVEGLVGSAHGDALAGDDLAAGNVLMGQDGGDTLFGNGGTDFIQGDAGVDVLVGGTGTDFLTGGADADFFTFLSSNDGADIVRDFAADDFMLIDGAGFQGLGSAPAFSHPVLTQGFAAVGAGPQFIYASFQGSGFLFFDADGSGAGAQIHIATLTSSPALTAGDIFIF